MHKISGKIRTGDSVIITTGADKGKTAKVVKVIKATNRVELEGASKIKRNIKPNLAERVGRVEERNACYHISNVSLLNGKKPSRVGFKLGKDKKTRVLRQAGNKEVK